jgi:hypothetical protein
MDRETLIRWVLILCSKTLVFRFRTLDRLREESSPVLGAEAWPGGDVQENPPSPADAASVSAA